MRLRQARKTLKNATKRARELAMNTASTAEWLADFVATTVRAESRHFAALAAESATEKLAGFQQSKNDALDPLAGVRFMDDPPERSGTA